MTDEEYDETPLAKAYEVIVAGEDIAGTSKQPTAQNVAPDDCVVPPLSLDALAKLSTISSVRAACIEAIARNVVGLGFDAVPRDHETPAADLAARRAELVKLLDALARRDTRLGRPSFSGLMFAVKTDEEEVGIGGLEVSRNTTNGKIDGLFHVPGKRLRRLRDQSGWLLTNAESGGTTGDTRFYNFGEKVTYTPGEHPEPTGELADGKRADVNELLVFRLYTSESRDYGLPRDHALALEYAADKLAAESNLSFFDSSGVPPTLLFIAGEESKDGVRTTVKVPAGTVGRITQTVKSDAGHKRAIAVIPLPAGTKVDKVSLAQRSEGDIGNNSFRQGIASRIMGAFRLPPIFVPGVGHEDKGGRFTAEVQRALTLEQVFDPEQEKYEGQLDAVTADLGYSDLRVAFESLAVEGDAAKRDAANALTLTSAITNAEQRQANGYGRLPEHETETDPEKAAADGKVPKGWNDRLVTPPKQQTGGSGPPFGGANDGGDQPHPDQRGLKPGIGQRQQVRDETGADGQPLAKHDGVDYVDEEARMLEVEFLEISDEGIDRALKRTMTIAEVVAGRVTESLEKRQAELDAVEA